jgi:tetratricopeptide (TPR) repeat protein
MESILRAGGLANFTALVRGFESLDMKARKELLAAIQSLLAEYPDNIQLRICQTLMLEELGQQKLALRELQLVFDVDPGQLQAIVLDAKLRQDMGQRKNIYKRIKAALEEQPGNMRLRMQYARLLTRTDLAEAERQFVILLEQEPEDPDLLFSLALIQRERANLDGARNNLERLLELNVRTDEAQYYLGKTAEDQERWDDALTHYMQVQPGRDFAAATDRIAKLLLASGRGAELGAWFDHLRLRYPKLSERLFAMEADKLIGGKHLTEAMSLLNRALDEFPNSISLLYSRSMLNEQLGNLELAEEDLRTIIALDPENSTALNALGYTLANRTNRYEEAADLIGRALTLDPQEPAILDSMGWVSYRLGDNETALKYLREAYSAFPDPEVAAHLGEVLWSSGDQEAALIVWNQALAESPGHAILLETMQRFGVDPVTD